jgi:hypothetical protein
MLSTPLGTHGKAVYVVDLGDRVIRRLQLETVTLPNQPIRRWSPGASATSADRITISNFGTRIIGLAGPRISRTSVTIRNIG